MFGSAFLCLQYRQHSGRETAQSFHYHFQKGSCGNFVLLYYTVTAFCIRVIFLLLLITVTWHLTTYFPHHLLAFYTVWPGNEACCVYELRNEILVRVLVSCCQLSQGSKCMAAVAVHPWVCPGFCDQEILIPRLRVITTLHTW